LAVVREFMNHPLLALDSEASVAKACRLMGEKHVGSILVQHKGVADAIFTERDLLSKVLPQKKDFDSVKVGDNASSPLITITEETDVKGAARIMAEMRVRRLVVVRGGKPTGIFTAADLARATGKAPLEL